MVLTIIAYAIFALAMWKVFSKMGLEGWKGIIPVYNIYVLFRELWDVKAFLQYLIVLIVSVILVAAGTVLAAGGIAAAAVTGTGLGASAVGVILMLAAIVLMVYALVVWIRLAYKLSAAFGHGAGFTVGMIFIPYIILLVLAFGSSEYRPSGR